MSEPVGNLANVNCGWASRFPIFQATTAEDIVAALEAFVRDSTAKQLRAWSVTVPQLQSQCTLVSQNQSRVAHYGAILEYLMPDSLKMADAILLISGAVLVVELKGDGNWQSAYREQAADYSRRLFRFHTLCGEKNVRVHTILASYGVESAEDTEEFLTQTSLAKLHEVVRRFDRPNEALPLAIEAFIAPEAYQPAPSLVQAVRNYYATHALPRIKRIDEITRPALSRVLSEIHDAHARQRRKLVLVSGVPGAGKTFVGMEIAHERLLDDLSEKMLSGEKPTAPAVFLSGNKPLVEVLQYEMRRAGGEGRVFVRHAKEFVARYSKRGAGAPPHHVLIFDEAQRAWDATRVHEKHPEAEPLSEPETFVRLASRVPRWSVVLGLVGEGQQIYTGEEGGIELWSDAVAKAGADWEVTGPERFRAAFAARGVSYVATDDLHLSRSVRFHFAAELSDWAAGIVEGNKPLSELHQIADRLIAEGYQLRITRQLDQAKRFLGEKYRDRPEARFGLLISGRDKGLTVCGVTATHARKFHAGPWFADPDWSSASCRRLTDAATEFTSQGLELDHTLLVWGTDFVRRNGVWDDSAAKRYQRKGAVKNPLQLRRNAYRVLLTRGREGVIICLPQIIRELDETNEYFLAAGCRVLEYVTTP